MEDKEKAIMDYLIQAGALEVSGIDNETGGFLYNFTNKLEEVMPELYDEHINHVNNEVMRLWEKGFVDIDLLDDNPMVKLSPKAFDEQAISNLSKEDRWSIEEIKRILG